MARLGKGGGGWRERRTDRTHCPELDRHGADSSQGHAIRLRPTPTNTGPPTFQLLATPILRRTSSKLSWRGIFSRRKNLCTPKANSGGESPPFPQAHEKKMCIHYSRRANCHIYFPTATRTTVDAPRRICGTSERYGNQIDVTEVRRNVPALIRRCAGGCSVERSNVGRSE